MPSTPISGLPKPATSDSPHGPAQIGALADSLDSKVIPKVANQAARDALPATAGLMVFRLDTGDYESNFGGTWSRIAGPLVQAKAWRTGGFSPTLTPDTPTTVDLTTARLSGGFTFDNANNTLTVPQNGHYELRGRGYVSGSSGYFFDFRIVRQRSAVADLEIVGSSRGRKTDASDESEYFSDTLPLQAGDKLLMRVTVTPGAGGAQTYYGLNETTGCHMAARYVGPLSGATPV